MILALAMVAHWVAWRPELVQMGVSIGNGNEERLIAMVPINGCTEGMKIYSGQFGDFEKGMAFVTKSHICDRVDARRAFMNAQKKP